MSRRGRQSGASPTSERSEPVFKNLIVYRIAPGWSATLEQVEEALGKTRFAPIGATQEKSVGWTAPRGEAHGALIESVGGQWICKLAVETKSVPASVVNRKVDERAAQIEQSSGRKPGKKERRDLKDEALQALLPQAFTKQSAVLVWIDTASRLLVAGTGAQGRADELTTLLVEALPGLSVALFDTQVAAPAAMADWLVTQEPPAGFSIDRECELKAADESKAVVRYARHSLAIDEVRQHVEQGKMPTKLALVWDDRVSFLLTEGMQLKKLTFLETVFEDGKSGAGKDEGFDADVAIATGELSQLLPDLFAALGGEAVPGAAPSAAATGPAPASAGKAPAAAPAAAPSPSAGDSPLPWE